MSEYGVTSAGFIRKPLSVILAELEAAMREQFGAGVVQTPQTPLGTLNGLVADAGAEAWEIGEDAYQARDPDQAEDVNLNILARIRLIERYEGESDESLRRAITNVGIANTRDADFYRSVRNVPGVTWAKIYTNDTKTTDSNGLEANTVSVVALGGSDEEVATVARQFIVPGISSYGNTVVSTEIEGFCRSINIMRPEEISLKLALVVSKTNGSNGCPPPSNAAIAQALLAGLVGDQRPANGKDITLHLLRTVVSCVFSNVEVISAQGALVGGVLAPLPFVVDFDQITTFTLNNITVVVA